MGTSLAVQWLRLCASSALGSTSTLGWGTRIPHATEHDQTTTIKANKQNYLLNNWINNQAFFKKKIKGLWCMMNINYPQIVQREGNKAWERERKKGIKQVSLILATGEPGKGYICRFLYLQNLSTPYHPMQNNLSQSHHLHYSNSNVAGSIVCSPQDSLSEPLKT